MPPLEVRLDVQRRRARSSTPSRRTRASRQIRTGAPAEMCALVPVIERLIFGALAQP